MSGLCSSTDETSSIGSLQNEELDLKIIQKRSKKRSGVPIPHSFLLHEVSSRGTKQSFPESTIEISIKPEMNVFMRPLQIVLASAIIQECIEKLEFMISNCPKVNSIFDFKDVNSRFNKFQLSCKDILIVQNDSKDVHWRRKLAMDVSNLQKALRIAKSDLVYDDHIVFHCYLRNELWKWRNENNLRHWHSVLSKTISSMTETSELLQIAGDRARKQSKISFFNMQELFEECSFKFGTAIEYVKKFNACRVEQNRLFIEEEEKNQLKKATKKGFETENEKLVHENVMKYYKKAVGNLEAEIIRWRQKYAKDMEEMEFKAYSLVTETSRQAAKLAEILALYCLREMQLETYNEKKEELFYLETSEYAMDILYTTIQSWWRGTIVRWELGATDADKKRKRQIKSKK